MLVVTWKGSVSEVGYWEFLHGMQNNSWGATQLSFANFVCDLV